MYRGMVGSLTVQCRGHEGVLPSVGRHGLHGVGRDGGLLLGVGRHGGGAAWCGETWWQ